MLCGALEGPEMCCVEHTDSLRGTRDVLCGALEGPEVCCVEP